MATKRKDSTQTALDVAKLATGEVTAPSEPIPVGGAETLAALYGKPIR
jgi:hypothetical protein